MRFLSKLPLICILGLINSSQVSASLYKVSFTYGDPVEGQNATLSGFMVIDTSIEGYSTQSQQDLGFVAVPNWITSVSMTFQASGSPAETTTDFDRVVWNLKTANVGNFDLFGNNIQSQFDGFGFRGTNNDYAIATNSTEQQHLASNAEFPLSSTATTPGGLPFLGLGALYFYIKELKINLITYK